MIEVENTKVKKRGRPIASKEINKAALLEIAVQEFANNGFDGTQQKIIAKKANITNSLMNYHFDSKEELWRQCVMQLGDKLKNRIQETQGYFKDLQGLSALKVFTRQFIYFSAQYPEFYKIVFHEMCTATERAAWLVEEILEPLHAIFEEVHSSNTDGVRTVEGIPISNFSSIVIGSANAFFIHSFQMDVMYGVKALDESEIERHADIVIDLIFAKFK